jgi:GT2 family glycosyltransferase
VQLLKRCLRSIRKQTDYLNYEIIIIDNGSKQRDTLRFLNRCRERVLRLDMPFNHSRLNNRAAQEARGDLLLLLNDDTEVINRDWLTALVEQAQRPSVGAVGAWLFHPDGRTQHAGIVLGGDAVAVNLHSGITRDGLDRGTVRLLRNASGVTAACMMIRKELYERMGGLDEDALPTSFNDVDLCLRLRQAGYAIVCTPLARLYHHESASRTIGDDEPFRQIMRERGRDSLDVDPFWNPNLCRAGTGFAFHRPAEATPSPAAWVARPGPA